MVCEGRPASQYESCSFATETIVLIFFVYQPSFIQEGFFIVLRCFRSYHLLGYTMYTASMPPFEVSLTGVYYLGSLSCPDLQRL